MRSAPGRKYLVNFDQRARSSALRRALRALPATYSFVLTAQCGEGRILLNNGSDCRHYMLKKGGV